jgi:hypothetical protein
VDTATAEPLLQPVLVPPTVKSAEVNPVTGSEKVIVTTMFSVLPNVSEVAVIVSVGAIKSTVSVVNCTMEPFVVPTLFVAEKRT